MTYTPGPWAVGDHWQTDDSVRGSIRAGDGTFLAELIGRDEEMEDWLAEDEANAQLIAAAPAMYEALKVVLARLDIEAQERGTDAIFCLNAFRPDIRAAIALVEEA